MCGGASLVSLHFPQIDSECPSLMRTRKASPVQPGCADDRSTIGRAPRCRVPFHISGKVGGQAIWSGLVLPSCGHTAECALEGAAVENCRGVLNFGRVL